MLSKYVWLLWLLGGVGAASAESLSFEAALSLAEQASADVAAQTAAVEAARSASIAAGALPDPKLELGVENLPVSGSDQWRLNRDFMTMEKIGVMQDIPNSAKRHAEAAAAGASIEQAEAQRQVRVLAVRQATALAWLNRYYVERRIALFDDLGRENQLLAQTVQAQLAGGRGMPADVIAPKQEAADLADRLDALHAGVTKAKAALRRLLGEAGDEPLIGEPPLLALDPEHLRTHVHTHPELAVFATMIAGAQAQVHKAEAAKRPDWGLELAYQHRAPQYSEMATIQLSFTLPLFASTRQDPVIASKLQDVARLESEREDMLREHTEVLDVALADYDAVTRQLSRMQETRLPLARQKVDYQLASYQAGKADVAAVIIARRELTDTQLMSIDLQSQRDADAAKIFFTYPEAAP
jgi:outer membrane protein, heavy metal efflux system